MKTVFIQRDQQEKIGYSRGARKIYGRWVTAWRIVDEAGVDLIQPWFSHKGEARRYAEASGWRVGTKP